MIYRTIPKTFNPQFEVVSCFFEYDGKILLLYRQNKKPQGDRWGVPAGKIDNGEAKIEAMVREIKEETSFSIPPGNLKYLSKVYIRHSDYHFVYHMFYTMLDSRPTVVINPNEHKDFTWVFPFRAMRMSLVPDLNKCLKSFYLSQYTKGIMRKEIEMAENLGEVLTAIVSALIKIKGGSSNMQIGYVSGIITSDGAEHVATNISRLAMQTEDIRRRHDFPIFSASDIFAEKLLRRLETNGFGSEDYKEFWRAVLDCGHVTDIFMTPRWKESFGAIDEHEMAKRLGIRIHYINRKLDGQFPPESKHGKD